MVKTDDRIYTFSYILKEIELNLSKLLDFLLYTMGNNLYERLKDSYESPIEILEEKLFNNIPLIDEKEYNKFTQYYFNIDKYEFSEKLFNREQNIELEKLKKFLANEIIDKQIKKMWTGQFLNKLIDFSFIEQSLEYLKLIKEKMEVSIYSDTIFHIKNNKGHILSNSEFITSEYNLLFAERINRETEANKIMEIKKKEMEESKKRDLTLMLNQNEMIDELVRINNYLLNKKVIENDKSKFHELYSLKHRNIINMISYGDITDIPPTFYECAIKILEGFYRNDTFDIDIITKYLCDGLFKKEYFYMYFYWIFIEENQKNGDAPIMIDEYSYPELIEMILNSLNKDVSEKFINEEIEYFERINNKWLTPFFYYYQILLKNTPPEWMKVEHILKLIVVTDPRKTGMVISTDVNLKWLGESFKEITSEQIIEYGLKIFDKLKNTFSRIQIIKYILEYYKSNEENCLNNAILDFIINSTKQLFCITITDHHFGEFQYFANFWRECNINHIDNLFPKFKIEIITAAIKKNEKDADYQYRKDVLLYCIRLADNDQRKRLISEIENDLTKKVLLEKENEEIHGFLASLGREKSIKYIILSYINGKTIEDRYNYYRYPLRCLRQNDSLLNDFINLHIYSTEKSTERRSILLDIAKKGIKQNLNNKNFRIFEKRMNSTIKKFRKQSSWQSEFYEEYLLEMEQNIFP
jgi:hypothetical protein